MLGSAMRRNFIQGTWLSASPKEQVPLLSAIRQPFGSMLVKEKEHTDGGYVSAPQ